MGAYSYIHESDYTNTFNGLITIGKYSCLAKGITFLCGPSSQHSSVINYKCVSNFVTSPTTPKQTKIDIIIGSDVWVGTKVIILPGVTIGDGAIIGAGCVVSKNIEPYAVVVGNPQIVKRKRFRQDIIDKLLKIRWWDWPENLIKERAPKFDDVEAFVNEFH